MQNPQQILIETQFEGLTFYVRPHETHEWLMETKLVAEGYGVSEKTIRGHKNSNPHEFTEGKHYLFARNSSEQNTGIKLPNMVRQQTFWTKRGVIRLGFFIKSARAKLFRDWAEDLIIRELNKNNQAHRVDLLEAKMHQYLDALYKMMKENKKDIQEMKELIHNLAARVDKIEAHLFKPHQLSERVAYFYLLRKVGKNEYKLGKSIDPLGRKIDFEAVNEEFELLATIRFQSEALALRWEHTFKHYFADKKIKGEWFALTPTDVALIMDLANVFDRYA